MQRCPKCNAVMEKESVPFVKEVGITLPTVMVNSSHYRCEDCDSEYIAMTGEKGLRQISGPDYDFLSTQ